jgi:hypothetical protein
MWANHYWLQTLNNNILQDDQSQNISMILFPLILTEKNKTKSTCYCGDCTDSLQKQISFVKFSWFFNKKLANGFLNHGCSTSVSENFRKLWNEWMKNS